MARGTSYVPDRGERNITLPQPQEMQVGAELAANLRASQYFAAQMQQPDYSMIIFRGSQGLYEVEDDWTGIWLVRSILLVNPFEFPVYVSGNDDPLTNGVAFPPQQALRLPLAGQQGSFVLAVNESDLTDNDAVVHLFRFATTQ